jgi:dTDP-glucose 4,6-dehydratase
MRNLLVTGGAGFIGSNFIRHVLGADPDLHCVNLDLLTYAGSEENLKALPDPERHTFIQGDICDRELVERLLLRHEIDTVVHFAAESHVDRSILGPAPFVRTNVQGTFTLLEAARQVWLEQEARPSEASRFHHISTDEVFGSLEPDDPPFDESTPYAPNSPYAASKAAADHLVRAYAHTYGLPVTLSNCSNNYGPYQFPEKLIPLVILNAAAGEPLPIYGDGKQVRDWLFVEDHCAAIYQVLRSGGFGETFMISAGVQPTNLQVVQSICEILDERLPDSPHVPHASLIEFVPDRPGHDRRYAMDNTKIRRDLGWQPATDLVSGLQKTVDWYLRRGDWLEAIRGQGDYEDWFQRNYANRGETT